MNNYIYISGKYVHKSPKALEGAQISEVQDVVINKLSSTKFIINKDMLNLLNALFTLQTEDAIFSDSKKIKSLPDNYDEIESSADKQQVVTSVGAHNSKVTQNSKALAVAKLFVNSPAIYLPTFMD